MKPYTNKEDRRKVRIPVSPLKNESRIETTVIQRLRWFFVTSYSFIISIIKLFSQADLL